MKTIGIIAALAVSSTLSACGGAEVASVSSATKGVICGTPTLSAVVTSDCSATAGADAAACLAGAPPVCAAGGGSGCACTGEGTNLWAAIGAVGLCSVNAGQTRAGWQSSLCAVQVKLDQNDLAGACARLQALESDILSKQRSVDKDIQHGDADLLRAGVQAAEDAITAAGTRCRNVTKLP